VYVKGELVGGCDITLDLFQSGELQKMLKEAVAGKKAA
jgi:monothiol glutaredoxin